jgi:hypothetical protein
MTAVANMHNCSINQSYSFPSLPVEDLNDVQTWVRIYFGNKKQELNRETDKNYPVGSFYRDTDKNYRAASAIISFLQVNLLLRLDKYSMLEILENHSDDLREILRQFKF